jgi:hypothetical protein
MGKRLVGGALRGRDPENTHAIDYRGPSVTVDLDDDWQAVYEVAPQRGDMVIGSVTIRPRRNLPAGGLTARLTRTLRPATALRLFRRDLAAVSRPGSIEAQAQAAAAAFLVAVSAAGSQEDAIDVLQNRWVGWDEALAWLRYGTAPPSSDRLRRVAETAALYVTALAEGRAPSERVARIQGRSTGQVRDDVRAARRAGLLSESPGRGRVGGALTERAREILLRK